MKGLIRKFQDYIKSQNTDAPIPVDARTLTLDEINQHFQLLTDTASNINIVETLYDLQDLTDKDPRKLGRVGFPCIAVTYEYEGEAESEFEDCAKWANRAADILQSDSEFTVIIEEDDVKKYVINQNNRTNSIKVGKSIIIRIFNKRISNFQTKFESFVNENRMHCINTDDNTKLIKYIEDNLMWDFKDNNIEYELYGHYNYFDYKGIIVQIFRMDNSDSDLSLCFNDEYDDACPLHTMITKLHQKLNGIIKSELKIESNSIDITIEFSFLDSKVNI